MRQTVFRTFTGKRVAIVMSEVFMRRLSPALSHFVRREFDFRIFSIHRPKLELLGTLKELNPAGLITEWLPDITESLVGLGIPTVIADTDELYPGCMSIDVDDWEVGREAARYFLKEGYQSCAFLGNGEPYSNQRREGFCEVINAAGLSFAEYCLTDPPGKRYMEDLRPPEELFLKWLHNLAKPTAIFVAHDPLGRYLCETCRELNISVPDQISVVGANDDPLVGGLSFPSLSSVRIPWDQLGMRVGESMSALLRAEAGLPRNILIPPGGVEVRQSSDISRVGDPMLRRALGWITQNHRETVGVADLTSDLKVSRRSLERKFKEYLRKTPYQVLCERRVETARRLIERTGESMSWIAEQSGFGDSERLSVVVKRVTGRTPTNFRHVSR